MTDERAASLPRRVLAWLIDVGIVATLSAAVALTQAETFTPASSLSIEQQDRVSEITNSSSLSWTVGETSRIWAGNALWITVAAIALILLIVLALLPANVGGWTPGMRVTGLRVITVSGNRARLHHHVLRNVVGLLDMFPFVIPGLLGWIVAWGSQDKQRLGDRAAGTKVVDQRHPERPVDPGTRRSRWKQLPEQPATKTPAVFDEVGAAAKNWAVLDVDANLPPAMAHTVARTIEEGRVAAAKPLGNVLPPLRRDQRQQTSTSGRPPAPLPASERRKRSQEPSAEPGRALEPPLAIPENGELDPTTEALRRMALDNSGSRSDHTEADDEPIPDDPAALRTVWSDEFEAWMYCDTTTRRWLKHNPESNRWVPVD